MKSVSIKGLGPIMVHYEDTYAAKVFGAKYQMQHDGC